MNNGTTLFYILKCSTIIYLMGKCNFYYLFQKTDYWLKIVSIWWRQKPHKNIPTCRQVLGKTQKYEQLLHLDPRTRAVFISTMILITTLFANPIHIWSACKTMCCFCPPYTYEETMLRLIWRWLAPLLHRHGQKSMPRQESSRGPGNRGGVNAHECKIQQVFPQLWIKDGSGH